MGSLAAIKTENDAPPAAIDLASVRKRLLDNRKALGARLLERLDVLAGLDTALIAGEHVLMVGPPGVAKSHLARSWASQIAGVYREDLLTRQSTEADHLAYLDVQAFTEGRYVYRYDGKLTEAHIAFVDEAFKATGGFLNALLGWLNERRVRGGFESPLLTAIAASNEFGEDDSVSALEDRLLFRFWVDRIADKSNRLAFLRNASAPMPPLVLAPITIEEIGAAQLDASLLQIDPLVLEALMQIQDSLAGAGVAVSDRRIGKCVRVLQAFAWLDGSPTVELDHLDILSHVLWQRPEHRDAVKAALGAVNRGMVGEVRAIVERLLDTYHKAKAGPDFGSHALDVAQQIEDAGKEIKTRYGGKIPDRLKDRVQGYLMELRGAFQDCKDSAKLKV